MVECRLVEGEISHVLNATVIYGEAAVPSRPIQQRNAHQHQDDHQNYILLDFSLHTRTHLGLWRNINLVVSRLLLYIPVSLVESRPFRLEFTLLDLVVTLLLLLFFNVFQDKCLLLTFLDAEG